jgi:phenylalanine-4-hydroxylase
MYLNNLTQQRHQLWLTCERSKEPFSSVNAREFLDYLALLELLNEESMESVC